MANGKTLAEVWQHVRFERGKGDLQSFRIGATAADGTKLVGTTAFHRELTFQRSMMQHIAREAEAGRDTSLLVVPSSVGCAPLTFAMEGELLGAFNHLGHVRIETTDIHQPFLDILADNLYPQDMARTIRGRARDLIVPQGPNAFSIREDVWRRVSALPAQDFRDFKPDALYDFVDCCNLLQHLDGQLAANVIKILSFAGVAAFFNHSQHVNAKAMDKAIREAGFVHVTKANFDSDPEVKELVQARRLEWVLGQTKFHVAVRPLSRNI